MNVDFDKLNVVFLCGGLGTRLRSVESQLPKVMVDINGRPFLDYYINHFVSFGIKKFVLCTGYKSEIIEDYYAQSDFVDCEFRISRENEPLGTGGAIKNARDKIDSDPFILLNGDCYCPLDVKGLVEQHIDKNAKITISAHEVENADDYGSLTINDKLEIEAFLEKQKNSGRRVVNVGMYCYSREVFDLMPKEEKFSLENDLYPSMIGKGLYAFHTDEEFMDIGTPERLEYARREFKKIQ